MVKKKRPTYLKSCQVTVKIPTYIVSKIDELVQAGLFRNRSDVIREAVSYFIEKVSNDPSLLTRFHEEKKEECKCEEVKKEVNDLKRKLKHIISWVRDVLDIERFRSVIQGNTYFVTILICPRCNIIINYTVGSSKFYNLSCPICGALGKQVRVPIPRLTFHYTVRILEILEKVRDVFNKIRHLDSVPDDVYDEIVQLQKEMRNLVKSINDKVF